MIIAVVVAGCGRAAPPAPEVSVSEPSTPASAPTPSAPPSTAATPTLSATPSPTPVQPRCRDLVAAMSLARAGRPAGHGRDRSGGLGSTTARTLAETRAGSVILLGNSTAGAAATRRLVGDVRGRDPPARGRPHPARGRPGGRSGAAAARARDSTGSPRRRTRPSCPTRSSPGGRAAGAVELGRPGSTPTWLRWPTWSRPTWAPSTPRSASWAAATASSPKVVAAKTSAFVEGMDRAGVATAVKHFPGLGRVRGNTDFARRVVDRPDHAPQRPGAARLPGQCRRRRRHGDDVLGVLQQDRPGAPRRVLAGDHRPRCCAAIWASTAWSSPTTWPPRR